ncbi:hypothetical protein [Solimonas soli]|uniref:hypothetical protein n=1 Tax=Solimonas soli TaxID=413479 RepID=UPI001B7F9478|nr:hypothetical protein [Solimonas soli]
MSLAMSQTEALPSSRCLAWWRGMLAGPLSFVTAALIMLGSTVWLPSGRAQIDNLVLPIVLFPLIWTALFLYALLARRLTRAYAVVGVLGGVNAALVAARLWA